MNILLKHQLRRASASRTEAKSLAALAERIAAVDMPTLDKNTKARIAADIGFGYQPHRQAMMRTWQGALAVLVVAVLIIAQTASPGTALYSVKQATDKVRTIIQHTIPILGPSEEPTHGQGDDRGNTSSPSQESPNSSGDRGGQGSGGGSDDRNNPVVNGDSLDTRGGGSSGSSGGSGSSSPSIDTSGSGSSGSSGRDTTTTDSQSGRGSGHPEGQ